MYLYGGLLSVTVQVNLFAIVGKGQAQHSLFVQVFLKLTFSVFTFEIELDLLGMLMAISVKSVTEVLLV